MEEREKIVHIVLDNPEEAQLVARYLEGEAPFARYKVEAFEDLKIVSEEDEVLLLEPSMASWKWLETLLTAIQEHPHLPVILYSPFATVPKDFAGFVQAPTLWVVSDYKSLCKRIASIYDEVEAIRKTVLIVDDDPHVLKAFTRILRKMPWTVYTVSKAERALNILQVEKVDAIVTDIKMPEVHGIDLISRIRTRNRSIPIIVCSGFGGMREDQELKFYNVTDFIEKPVNPDDFKKRIEAAMAA